MWGGRVSGARPGTLGLVGDLATDLRFISHRVQQLPRAQCLATFRPTMGCPEAPSRQVSFRYVLGSGACARLVHWARRAGGRQTGEQRRRTAQFAMV